MTVTHNKLENRDGRWFENGKFLPKKDYIYHADCHTGGSITSCRTNTTYRIGRNDKRVIFV